MRVLCRCLTDQRHLWRLWLPLTALAVAVPLVVLMMPLLQGHIIDDVIVAQRLDLLPQALLAYGGLWVLSVACQVIGSVLRAALSEQVTIGLRQQVFAKCQMLSVAFSRQEHSGQTMALFANDVPSVGGAVSTSITAVISSAVSILGAAAIMVSLNWQLALVAGVVPPLVAAAATVVTRPLRPAARQAQAKAAELTERLQENMAGLREMIAFGQHQSRSRGLTTLLDELFKLRMRVTFIETGLGIGQSVLSLMVLLTILGFGGYLVIQGEATLGELVAMQSLFGYVFQPAMQITGLISTLQKAAGSADRIYAFLDEEPRVQERPLAFAPRDVTGHIVFDHVTFAYEAGEPVLHDISVTANPGEMIAIVGPSGAGKTTLVSLIARFYDPTAGRLLLDGHDLRDLTLDSLRDQIAFVFQDTFLFATTIRENIAFGRDGATDDQILTAARSANAWEFIERMPNGMNTMVGERGVRLSEGQRQRIAIARALLRDPRILIMDEPTSALDARSEQFLAEALDRLMQGRTTFVVAHRLATIRRADRILVLEDGRIVESGTHGELLGRERLYAELHRLQVREDGVAQLAHSLVE